MSGPSRHHSWPVAPAREWRQQLLNRTLFVGALFGPLALVPSIVLAWNSGLIAVAISDILAYVVWLGALFARGVRLEVRAAIVVAVALHLGIILLFTVGTAGASFVWLAAPVFLAMLFLWLPGLIVTAGAVIVALAVCTVVLMRGALGWSITPGGWVVLVANYAAVTSFLVTAIAYLLSRISRSLRDEQIASREREILISEINHRVKNNLQTMVSLVRLQEADEADERVSAALGRIELRVLAMSLAHEQIYRDSREAGVSARALLTRVASEAGQRLGCRMAPALHEDDLAVVPDHAAPLSLLVVEFLSICVQPSSDRHGVSPSVRIEVTSGPASEITIALEPEITVPWDAAAWRVVDALGNQIGCTVARGSGPRDTDDGGTIAQGSVTHGAAAGPASVTIQLPPSSGSGVQPSH